MENDRKGIISCSSFVVENDVAWLFHSEFNALLKVDLETEKTYYVTSFEEEKRVQSYLINRILKIGCYILLVPGFANNIYVYDIEKNLVVYKRNIRDIYNSNIAFCDACVIGNKVYCFPYSIDKPITIINVNELEEVQFIELLDCKISSGYFNHCASFENKIYAVNPSSNYLTCVNPENGVVEYKAIDISSGMIGVTSGESNLYIQAIDQNKFMQYDPKTDKVEKTICLRKSSDAIGYYGDNKMWVDTNDIYAYVVDLEKNVVLEVNKLESGEQLADPRYGNGPNYSTSDYFYYFNQYRSSIIRHTLCCEEEIMVRLEGHELTKMNEEVAKNVLGSPISESNYLQLSDFLALI